MSPKDYLSKVERMLNVGFIQGSSKENAIVCSASKGWLNPALQFQDEPCRHKVLDLISDLSLLAQNEHQGIPVAHLMDYKVFILLISYIVNNECIHQKFIFIDKTDIY